ncbi:MAG: response regulator transcription factor [Chloroflexota bacterium]|nr:response regulator transcription factor [Chloroflexia bacterium]MDQ3442064.1 response regulator transcription factor [Chloroflexota bacterium]
MISVLLVDDHPVVIEGLRKLLEAAGDIDVTGTAHDAAQAIERAKTLRPDVILLDLRMPGATGIQATRRLREQAFEGAIILLTSYGDQAYVRQALEAGADGYLLKSTPSDELIDSIRSGAKGRRQLSPELLDGVLQDFGGLAREKTVRDSDLSDDDLDILRLAGKGATNREIGLSLNRSEIAIKKRLQVIFAKLGAVDRANAVAEAIRRGLI